MLTLAVINPLAMQLNNLYLQYIKVITIGILVVVALVLGGHYLIIGPKEKRLGKLPPEILRLNTLERTTHLIRMVSFLLLAITGITFALFNSDSIGIDYNIAYKIHIIFAILFGVSSFLSIIIWFKDSIFKGYDWEWIKVLGGYLTRREIHPPAGKFNAGQKFFYWYSALISILLICSGIILAYPRNFPLEYLVWSAILHGLSAVCLIAGVIAHAYLGSFANPGTIGTIIHGKVAKDWAKKHHPQWYKQNQKERNG